MIAAPTNSSQRTLTVDELFARLHEERTGSALPPGGGMEAPSAPNGTANYPGPQPPPVLESPADLQTAHDWLQTERQRLESYTRSQFAAIQQQHQSLLAKQFRSEEALALRAQELNREMKFLASQAEALQSRARELAERETALAVQVERLAAVEQEILALGQAGAEHNGFAEAHAAVFERLRADMAQLWAAGTDAGSAAAAVEASLKEHQQAWEKKHADLVARQEQMEQRYQALDKAEETSQRRLAELDELETLLRREFEQQEKQLALERQEIEVLRTRLRVQIRKLEEGLNEAEEDAVPV